MSETKADDTAMKFWATVLVAPWVFASLFGLTLAGIFWETYVAMTIWSWFAPWPVMFTLVQGVGMNAAVTLVIRSPTRAKDERTAAKQLTDTCLWYFAAPAVALGMLWLVKWWS